MTEVNDDLIWNNIRMVRLKYNTNNIRIEYEAKLKDNHNNDNQKNNVKQSAACFYKYMMQLTSLF